MKFVAPALFHVLAGCMGSCRMPGQLFSKKSPHELYAEKLKNAGLDKTAMGRLWFDAASNSITDPLHIDIPFKETAYFPSDGKAVTAMQFGAIRGQKLSIRLEKKPSSDFTIYVDLFSMEEGSAQILASADTTGKSLDYEVKKTGKYLLRLQPELLSAGEYTLSISAGPSLGYPVKAPERNRMQSFFGDGRDAGTRSHEGVDIFAPRNTPALAASDGRVGRVNTNNLGGKVVWFRPENKDYNLYYAHLDSQLVQEGQFVKAGDTLGLVGNTGNARTTGTHLHFGIYASGGAVDPYAFINPVIKNPRLYLLRRLVSETFIAYSPGQP